MAPRVHKAAEEDLHALVARIETEHAASLEPHHAVRRLGVGPRVNGLTQVQPPVRSPAQGVQIVVGILGAKAA